MGVILNKTILIFIVSVSFAFGAKIEELSFEKKEIAKLMYKELLQSIIVYDKKSEMCEKREEENILNPKIFKNLGYDKDKLKTVLYFLWYKAKNNCSVNEKNQLSLNFYKFKMLVKEYKLDTQYLEQDYLMYFTSGYKSVLKDEINYLKITDEKTREYFDSVMELKEPFNFKKTLHVIQKTN